MRKQLQRLSAGLRVASPIRLWNAAKVTSSFYVSKWTGKPHQWGMPIALSIEPTTACNLGCPECPSGLKQFSRPTGNLKDDTFQNLIAQAGSNLMYLNFYFQGEPYIHPGFLDMVAEANRRGVVTSTSTNAHFLTPSNAARTVESGLRRLIISIDGTTQETYESYRIHGSLDKVLEGTKNILEAKRKAKSSFPQIVFQFLAVKPNEHQIEEVKALGKEMGVDEVRIKTAQVYDYENGNDLIPENESYSRYKLGKDGKYHLKNRLDNHCWRMWHSCVITWDGKVVPCCFDKDAHHQVGDTTRQSFRSIWRGEAYNRFRSSVLGSRKDIDICANCSEGTKVWA